MKIAVSGGFDPLHEGHIKMIQNASEYGDVVVILNSDEWLRKKKGYCFQSWKERASILYGLKGVLYVTEVDDSDGTVKEALSRIKPDYFANGGDRKPDNTPEADLCDKLGINQIFGVGGTDKPNSSRFIPGRAEVQREWGTYRVIAEDHNWKLKRLELRPCTDRPVRTSLQKHNNRDEHFCCVGGAGLIYKNDFPHPLAEGETLSLKRGDSHMIVNYTPQPFVLLETQYGECTEDDITRL